MCFLSYNNACDLMIGGTAMTRVTDATKTIEEIKEKTGLPAHKQVDLLAKCGIDKKFVPFIYNQEVLALSTKFTGTVDYFLVDYFGSTYTINDFELTTEQQVQVAHQLESNQKYHINYLELYEIVNEVTPVVTFRSNLKHYLEYNYPDLPFIAVDRFIDDLHDIAQEKNLDVKEIDTIFDAFITGNYTPNIAVFESNFSKEETYSSQIKRVCSKDDLYELPFMDKVLKYNYMYDLSTTRGSISKHEFESYNQVREINRLYFEELQMLIKKLADKRISENRKWALVASAIKEILYDVPDQNRAVIAQQIDKYFEQRYGVSFVKETPEREIMRHDILGVSQIVGPNASVEKSWINMEQKIWQKAIDTHEYLESMRDVSRKHRVQQMQAGLRGRKVPIENPFFAQKRYKLEKAKVRKRRDKVDALIG